MIGFFKAAIGLATGVFLFFMLPVWLLGFDWITNYRFIERSRRFRDRMIFGDAIVLLVAAWLIWRYVLPNWWIRGTPLVSYDE